MCTFAHTDVDLFFQPTGNQQRWRRQKALPKQWYERGL